LAAACWQKTCTCESFTAAAVEKGATIDAELERRFMEHRRTYLALEKTMRERGLELKSE